MRTLGDYSNRRRLLGNDDDLDDDLDHNDDADGFDLDDDRRDVLVAVFGFLFVDVVGLGAILDPHDERLFGRLDLDDHNDDDHNDHNDDVDLDNDGRPLRPNDDHNDDVDLDDLGDNLDLDDLDIDDDAGPVWLLLSDVLRRERRRLYDDGLRSRDAGDADPIVYLDDDLDLDLDV